MYFYTDSIKTLLEYLDTYYRVDMTDSIWFDDILVDFGKIPSSIYIKYVLSTVIRAINHLKLHLSQFLQVYV